VFPKIVRSALDQCLNAPRRLIDSYTGSLNRNTIEYWQHYIFYVIALVGVIAGTLCIVPSVILLLAKGQPLSGLILVFLYSVNVIALFARRPPLKTKTLLIGAGFYLIGIVSLIAGGPVGESGIWFATTCLLCSLFAGFRFALASAVINLLTGIAFGVAYAQGWIAWYFLKDYTLVSWIIQSSNIFMICVMFAIANSILIKGVNATFIALNATEEKIRASLEEKETLIGELYHRTKNNMQVISSLLMLHSSEIADVKAKAVMKEIETKIRSMSLVHKKLYQSRNLASIDMAEYVRELVALLIKSNDLTADEIAFDAHLENISFPIDTAIPCGLVMNEIITNSLKYAFPEGRNGTISVRLKMADAETVELAIADDGVGVGGGFDPERDGKMGIRTIMLIVRHQLRGDIRFEGGNGVSYLIRFKLEPYGNGKSGNGNG
jgi:two-component sensor histidine kinase